jgi:hypothetical protein
MAHYFDHREGFDATVRQDSARVQHLRADIASKLGQKLPALT